MDELLARTSSGGTTAWYLSDRLGTVRDIASSAGAVIYHASYDSYGKVLTESGGASGDRFKYAGMEYDAAIALYYDNARYYDPAVGRFTALDPIGLGGGDPNFYRYVGNGPTNATDPTGLARAVANTEVVDDQGRSYPAGTNWNPKPAEPYVSPPSMWNLDEWGWFMLGWDKRPTYNGDGKYRWNRFADPFKYWSDDQRRIQQLLPPRVPRPPVDLIDDIGHGRAPSLDDLLPLAGAAVGANRGRQNRLTPAVDPNPTRAKGAPAAPGDAYSPREVSKRQSDLRRQLGVEPDPNVPIPDQGPGRNLGGHPAKEGTPHDTGERNVGTEEHSRVTKGPRMPR